VFCRCRKRLLRKTEASAGVVQQPTVSRWIKPRAEDDSDGAETEDRAGDTTGDADDEEAPRRVGKTSSAPPSCYSMAAAEAAVLATVGLRQRALRTARPSRSTSQLSSYDLASALQTINSLVMNKSMRIQKATRLVGLEDPTASPRKRTDKVRFFRPDFTVVSTTCS